MAIFGAHPGAVNGEVLVKGRPVDISNPADAIKHGIGFVTEDRKRFGLVLDQNPKEYDPRRSQAHLWPVCD